MTKETPTSEIEENRDEERDEDPTAPDLAADDEPAPRAPRRPTGEQLLGFLAWMQVRYAPHMRRIDWAIVKGSTLALTLAFVSASIVSTSSASIMFSTADRMSRATQRPNVSAAAASIGSVLPSSSVTKDLKDRIVLRNLFNSDGQLAPDDAPQGAGTMSEEDMREQFERMPCTEEKLPVEVLGVIVRSGPEGNLVALKDPKVETADIYRSGDVLIDHEDYAVHQIQRDHIEFRKGDAKICVSPQGVPLRTNATSPLPSVADDPDKSVSMAIGADEIARLVGPGGSKAQTDAKLIPDGDNGSREIRGYRLLAVKPGSIFDRLKLKNRDVLVEVNGESLRDPTKGYRVYEVLDREREITIHFERNGERMTRKVTVQ